MSDTMQSHTPDMSDKTKARESVLYREESETQTLQIKYKNWKCNTALMTDSETSDPLYDIEFHLRKPNIVFKSAIDDTDVGRATFQTFKSRIETQVHGNTLELTPKRFLSMQYSYVSPALQDRTLTWTVKWGWKNVTYTCLDEKSLPLARFKSDCWSKSMKAVGKIEFLGTEAESQAARDELVVTGFTLAYQLILMH